MKENKFAIIFLILPLYLFGISTGQNHGSKLIFKQNIKDQHESHELKPLNPNKDPDHQLPSNLNIENEVLEDLTVNKKLFELKSGLIDSPEISTLDKLKRANTMMVFQQKKLLNVLRLLGKIHSSMSNELSKIYWRREVHEEMSKDFYYRYLDQFREKYKNKSDLMQRVLDALNNEHKKLLKYRKYASDAIHEGYYYISVDVIKFLNETMKILKLNIELIYRCQSLSYVIKEFMDFIYENRDEGQEEEEYEEYEQMSAGEHNTPLSIKNGEYFSKNNKVIMGVSITVLLIMIFGACFIIYYKK